MSEYREKVGGGLLKILELDESCRLSFLEDDFTPLMCFVLSHTDLNSNDNGG